MSRPYLVDIPCPDCAAIDPDHRMLRMESKLKKRGQIGTLNVEQDWDHNLYSLECKGCGKKFTAKVGPGPDGQPALMS